ncbi:MAG: Gfo/Idh/MocA family oxidoreductase [Verrucomicrobia bacterium]|nr:Gfo/Idh/MocA family oxidoreductase [Verrucomicrobiota bacterium]MCH8511207.1 Gfo/Idh/MocA family oxidoreductase [Kiritimatiellia bacterium]
MKKLKCAVIGLGMGHHHLLSYQKNSRAELVGAADLDEKKLKRAEEASPGIRTFTDYAEMLRVTQPDVVSIALPNSLHLPVAVACMEAGADVLCEKPMSTDLAGALKMQSEAERLGRTIYMNLSQRFNPFHRAARKLVDSGVLGEVYHGYTSWTRRDGMPGFGGWFGQKALSGGGPLIDLGVHRIDIALWLMGTPKPVTVSGVTHHRRGIPLAHKQGKVFDVEDFASGLVRFENGASLLFEISWAGYQEDHERQALRLVGTDGGLEAEPGANGWELVLSHDIGGIPMASRMPAPKGNAPYSCEELVDSILDGTDFPATARDGIRMQIILDALYASAESGHEIDVKSFAPEAFALL